MDFAAAFALRSEEMLEGSENDSSENSTASDTQGSWEDLKMHKWAVWMNLGLGSLNDAATGNPIQSFSLAFRLLGQDYIDKGWQTAVDAGISYSIMGQGIGKLSFIGESVYRYCKDQPVKDSQWRFMANFAYKLEKNKSIVATFGKGFKEYSNEDFIAKIGLVMGFGNKKIVTK